MWQLPEVKGKSLFRKVDGREKATVKSAFDLSLGTIFIYSIYSLDYFLFTFKKSFYFEVI